MNIHCCIILTYFSTPLCSNGVHEVPVNLFLFCFLERAHLGVRHFLGGRRRLLSAEEVLGHGVDGPCLLCGLDYLQSRVYEGLFCFVLHLHLHVSGHLLRSVVCPHDGGDDHLVQRTPPEPHCSQSHPFFLVSTTALTRRVTTSTVNLISNFHSMLKH